LNWLERLKSDNEGGVKHAFATKLKNLKSTKKKISKSIDKISKSGKEGVKQAIKKQFKKSEKKDQVQMEEFEVEINEFE
jgi:BMFP domain-containing protein YqiC